MGTLSEDTINTWIVPYLPVNKRGFSTTVSLSAIVKCILYRLKTGCQWRDLPVKQFFGEHGIGWNSVFYHFNKWSKAGCWAKIWQNFLYKNRCYLDMSSVQLDGSQSVCKNGGEAVGYQKRKRAKSTNALFLCDKQGVMLAMATPQEGQHHDLYQIKQLFEEICVLLQAANIKVDGLFLNADAGFDSQEFRDVCEQKDIIANIKPNPRNANTGNIEISKEGTHIFDEELYQERVVVEHANAWIDGFRALLVRFETSLRNWCALHFLAFMVIFIKKITKIMKV